jgi:hypothetical protein
MSTHWLIGALVSLGPALVCAGAASTAELRDDKTGLAVDPPAGFTARIGQPTMGETVQIEVERESPATDCSVTFEEMTANLGLTQPQINDLAKKKEVLDTVRTMVGVLNEILSLDHATQDGVVGVVLILKSKMLAHMRTYQAFFETRRGRTVIVCVANQDEFDGFRKDYENIMKGVRFPR